MAANKRKPVGQTSSPCLQRKRGIFQEDIVDGPPTATNDLCARCGKLDFDSEPIGGGWWYKYELWMELVLTKALTHSRCAMCELICRYTNNLLQDYGGPDTERVTCKIWKRLEDVDTFKVAEVEQTTRSEILHIEFIRGKNAPTKAKVCSVYLDILHPKFHFNRCKGQLLATRRRMPSAFDRQRLRRLLDRDDAHESASCSSTHKAILNLISMQRFRVIDVTTSKLITVDRPVKYLALSYIWGDPTVKQRRACQSPLLQAESPVAVEELPKTFRETIDVVRSIGERYVWIDALCIRRDLSDTSAIIPCMGDIYSSAYLTIVAAHGKDADAGLGRLNGFDSQEYDIPRFYSNGRLISLLEALPSLSEALRRSKWGSRAWTFQELLLARRSVVSTTNEVFFISQNTDIREAFQLQYLRHKDVASNPHCKEHWKNAISLDAPDAPNLTTIQVARVGLYREASYPDLVDGYTSRSFTYAGDKLDAFFGAYNLFEPELSSTAARIALSGLSKHNFVHGLNFSTLHGSTRIPRDHRRSRNLPSWSWVGWTDWMRVGGANLLPGGGEIKDEANVICNLDGTAPTSEPILCRTTRLLSVTLHLWTTYIKCTLREGPPEPLSSGEEIALMEPKTPHNATPLNEILGDDFGVFGVFRSSRESTQHCLIRLSTYAVGAQPAYLVVERRGSFYERIGRIGIVVPDSTDAKIQIQSDILRAWEAEPVWIRMR